MMVFLLILMLAAGIVIFGFFYGFTTFHVKKKVRKGQCRVACIGDSITYGCGVKNWPKNNYPAVLGKMLGSKYCVINYGYSARTLMSSGDHPYIKETLFQKSLAFEPDIVIVKLGTNDAKAENWKNKEAFKEEYKRFLASYQKLSSSPKIYLCTPSATFYPEENSNGKIIGNVTIPPENLREAVHAVLELGEELDIPVIDIYSFTRGHRDWFFEGLHPNALGARMLAEEIFRNIKA